MKEKIKKIFRWFLNNWRTFAEIGVIIWAIQGMYRIITITDFLVWLGIRTGEKEIVELYLKILEEGVNILLIPLLFYFLSALLILYLLRKKDKPKSTL